MPLIGTTGKPQTVSRPETSPNYATGDLWDYFQRKYWVVITTNIGWKSTGENVMGAGCAQQATKRFPELPLWYGRLCQKYKDELGICIYQDQRMLLMPVKRLNPQAPQLSWQAPAELAYVTASVIALVKAVNEERLNKIVLGFPGCGNGGLEVSQVKPILNRYLDQRFTVLTYQRGQHAKS